MDNTKDKLNLWQEYFALERLVKELFSEYQALIKGNLNPKDDQHSNKITDTLNKRAVVTRRLDALRPMIGVSLVSRPQVLVSNVKSAFDCATGLELDLLTLRPKTIIIENKGEQRTLC